MAEHSATQNSGMQKSRSFRFSLRALLLAVTVISIAWGILLIIGESAVTRIPQKTMTEMAMREIAIRIGMYVERENKLPGSIDGLPVRQGYMDRTTDGWRHPLIYTIDDDSFSLTSLGKDGARGGIGDDEDTTKTWRLLNGKLEDALP